MIRNWKTTIALSTVVLTATVIAFINQPVAVIGESSGPEIGNAQFRRTVESSERSASGSVSFRTDGAKETCTVIINGLGEKDFAVYVSDFAEPVTNATLTGISPLGQLNLKKGTWGRKYVGTAGAPLEFPVETLHQLEGGIILIGHVTTDNDVQDITNVVNGVTNVIFALPMPLLTDKTNIVTTGLWAPIPPIVPRHTIPNFKAHVAMTPDPIRSPNAVGSLSVQFNAATGRSVLDINSANLDRGQTYTIWVGEDTSLPPDPVTLINSGTMTASKSGSSQSFLSDTQFGDPLPLQARDVTDLSGHLLIIRDANGFVPLTVVIP